MILHGKLLAIRQFEVLPTRLRVKTNLIHSSNIIKD